MHERRIILPRVSIEGANRSLYFVDTEREMRRNLSVLKFGGTSVGNAEAITQVAQIISDHRNEGQRPIVVVSAMNGITATLDTLLSNRDHLEKEKTLEQIAGRHVEVSNNLLLSGIIREKLQEQLHCLFRRLREDVFSNEVITPEIQDRILASGERASVLLVQARCLEVGIPVEAIDSSEIIVTDDNFGNAEPDHLRTRINAEKLILPALRQRIAVLTTGFFGATQDGRVAILGKNCSDTSAATITYALEVPNIFFYKDVNGIYTADPKSDPQAVHIPYISYEGCDKIAGVDKTIHPRAREILKKINAKVTIRNTFDPKGSSTEIFRPAA